MESYPPPPPPPPSATNGLGIAGFVVSLTCVLAPLGLILSLVALRRRPKGLAIAGTVIGGLGTVLLGLTVFTIARNPDAIAGIKTVFPLAMAKKAIEEHRAENDALPSEEEGNRLIEHLEDGWGTPLGYELHGDEYVVRSAGPDREFGTADDIPP